MFPLSVPVRTCLHTFLALGFIVLTLGFSNGCSGISSGSSKAATFAPQTTRQDHAPLSRSNDHSNSPGVRFPGHGQTPLGSILWSTDFESGGLTQWYAPNATYGCRGRVCNGGGEYDSGCPGENDTSSAPSQDFAHSGLWSDKLSVLTPSPASRCPGHRSSGARMFRWLEGRNQKYWAPSGLYYSVWVYFPHQYRLTHDPRTGRFFNLIQYKSVKTKDAGSDVMWAVDVSNRDGSGNMYARMAFARDHFAEGPHKGDDSSIPHFYQQPNTDIPVGKWVHFETYLAQSSDYAGEIKFWQDDVLVADESNVITKYPGPGGDNAWSVNAYSDGTDPNPATIYIDDAAIGTAYIP